MNEPLIAKKNETYERGKKVLNGIWWILLIGDLVLFLYWLISMIVIQFITDDVDVNFRYRVAQAFLGFHTLNTAALFSVKIEHENNVYAALGLLFFFVLGLDLWSLLDIRLHLAHDNTDIWTIMFSIAVWSVVESGAAIVWFIFYYFWHRTRPISSSAKKTTPSKKMKKTILIYFFTIFNSRLYFTSCGGAT
jgi:hypothetical protein